MSNASSSPDTNLLFSFAMKAARAELGLSQAMLAEKTGLSVTTVNHTERCTSRPDLTTLEKIAAALNNNVSQMLLQGKLLMVRETESTRKRLAVNLKKLRKERKLTQTELAVKSGLSLSTISCVELGKSAATVDALHQMAVSLDVDVQDLFDMK